MAELSVEEASRLARSFLTGKSSVAETDDLKAAVENDPQAALELLQQMQTALEDTAPAGFTPDQWREIDARVASLMAPLAKSRLGFLGKIFGFLFKKKSPAPEAPTRIKRKAAPPPPPAPEPAPAPASEASADGMEEMAPIAPAAAAPAPAPAPAASQPEAAPEAPREAGPSKLKAMLGSRALWFSLLILALLALLAFGGMKAFAWWKSRKPAPAPAAPPTPVPTPAPTPAPTKYAGPPRRAVPQVSDSEPLPSELPPQTPQPAGQVRPIEGLDARDSQGRRALPLP